MAYSDNHIRAKRRKLSDSEDNPYLAHLKDEEDDKSKIMANPYLAHMQPKQEDDDDETYGNGHSGFYHKGNTNSKFSSRASATNGSLAHFPRHNTTSAMARKAEDGPNNPFNGQPLSEQYFNILKTRRDLPVQAQRCGLLPFL